MPIADRLLADVIQLRQKVAGVTLTPLELANGAKSLLDEVATRKVTGEEDRYSHTAMPGPLGLRAAGRVNGDVVPSAPARRRGSIWCAGLIGRPVRRQHDGPTARCWRRGRSWSRPGPGIINPQTRAASLPAIVVGSAAW